MCKYWCQHITHIESIQFVFPVVQEKCAVGLTNIEEIQYDFPPIIIHHTSRYSICLLWMHDRNDNRLKWNQYLYSELRAAMRKCVRVRVSRFAGRECVYSNNNNDNNDNKNNSRQYWIAHLQWREDVTQFYFQLQTCKLKTSAPAQEDCCVGSIFFLSPFSSISFYLVVSTVEARSKRELYNIDIVACCGRHLANRGWGWEWKKYHQTSMRTDVFHVIALRRLKGLSGCVYHNIFASTNMQRGITFILHRW